MINNMIDQMTNGTSNPSQPGIKFLLITLARSGTMMVANVLEKRTEVALNNLYASNPDQPHVAHALWCASQYGKTSHKGTTMHFIDNLWIKQHSPIPVDQFWNMVAQQHDRYICLHRENLLFQYLSHQVGHKIGTYDVLQPRDTKPIPPTLNLNVKAFQEFIEGTTHLWNTITPNFPGRLCLTYEQLCQNWGRCWTTIQDYLELPVQKNELITYKQENRSLRESIENYDEMFEFCTSIDHQEWMEEV